MKITVLGCSGSMSGPASPASSYLLQANWPELDRYGMPTGAKRVYSLVLDMGPGSMGRLLDHIDPHYLDGIALSHCHADHMVDMIGMHVYRRWWPDGPLGPVPVLGPAGTIDRVRGVGGDPQEETYTDEFTFYQHTEGSTWDLGPFKVESFKVMHPVETYAMRITGPSEYDQSQQVTLTYSGDSDVCPGLIKAAQEADLFLCEAAFERGRDTVRGIHLDGYRAGQVAAQAGAKLLVLTHLQPWTDQVNTLNHARENYRGPVYLAARDQIYTI